MADKHCIVIRDLPSQDAVNYRFGKLTTKIDNGHVIALTEMIDHDLWAADAAPQKADDNLWLVTGVELMYEEYPRKHLWDYYNEANKAFRCERVLAGGIYSISKEGLVIADEATDLVKGAAVMFNAGSNALTVAATAAGTVIGKVIDVYTKSGVKFAAIQFEKHAATV